MRPPRRPVVAGLAPGVGTSTLAAALHAYDGGVVDCGVRDGGLHDRRAGTRSGGADVVVCRLDEETLRHAALVVPTRPGAVPVLAVTCCDARPVPTARLRAATSRFAAVVLLPDVPRWRGLTDPVAEAAVVLGQAPTHLPRALRQYAAALRQLVEAVIASDRLTRPAPSAVALPRAVAPRRAPQPVQRLQPVHPVLVAAAPRFVLPPVTALRAAALPEPDDDELEAGLDAGPTPCAVASGRAG